VTIRYLARRLPVFFGVVWVAATLNFVIPRLAPGDPVGAILAQLTRQGGRVAGSAEIIASYRATFGLDDPLPIQYIRYLAALTRFDLGPSLTYFPTPVSEIVTGALPWTLGLLVGATLFSFAIGTILGALLVWRGTPRLARAFLPPLAVLAAIPYYLVAIVLLSLFAFWLPVFPASGTQRIGEAASTGIGSFLDIVYHSALPALSIILATLGGWMLGMRGTLVNVLGSEHLMLAEAKGLSRRRIFVDYALRNAILPQVTGLAIALGTVVSGAVLVEVVFSYPGLGLLLLRAIQNADYTLIQGITFFLVVAVGLAVLLLDLVYPLLDPRISYEAA
jgi:peptide/nickel transport system permease protein